MGYFFAAPGISVAYLQDNGDMFQHLLIFCCFTFCDIDMYTVQFCTLY